MCLHLPEAALASRFSGTGRRGREPNGRAIKTGYKMAASLGRIGSVSPGVFYLLLSLELLAGPGLGSPLPCAQNCTCDGDSVDCSDRELAAAPLDLPVRTVSL